MNGPTPPAGPPRTRRPAGLKNMAVRTLFASFPLWSLGLLAWVPALRFALLRQRRRSWAVLALSLALTVLYILLLEIAPKSDEEGAASFLIGLYIVIFLVGSCVHGFLGDRFPRPVRQPRPFGPGGPGSGESRSMTPESGRAITWPVGFPPAAQPVVDPTADTAIGPAPPPPAPPVAAPHATEISAPSSEPATGPAANTPTSPRMRRVASELAELDELLRQEESR